jgi:hypothetical protein
MRHSQSVPFLDPQDIYHFVLEVPSVTVLIHVGSKKHTLASIPASTSTVIYSILCSSYRPTTNMPLFDLLICYEVRGKLLRNLSAYDVAKLDMVVRGFLDLRERRLYLNPLRDIIWDIAEVKYLEAHGMRLLLMGNDVLALQQRLDHPRRYIKRYGHTRKLQIYLIGYCPVMNRTTGIRDRILSFSILQTPSQRRVEEDTLHMRRMKGQIMNNSLRPDAIFIMSFGAILHASRVHGSWLHVSNIPDLTIDLRIYVPSFHDRQWGEVQFPCRETWHLSKCALRKLWLFAFLGNVLCMYLNTQNLSVAHLTVSGIQALGPYGRLWVRKQILIQCVINPSGFST